MKSSIDEIIESWYVNMADLLPEEMAEEIRENVRSVISELVSGRKSVDEIIASIDDGFIEGFLRKSRDPVTFLEGLETLIKAMRSVNRNLYVSLAPTLLQFETKILKKIIGIYARVLQTENAEKERIARALRVLSLVNEAILRIDDEHTLMSEVCRIVVEEGRYAYAWIGYAEKDMQVRPIAAYRGDDYIRSIKITWDESETGMGPTGTAIRTGKAQILRDVTASERYAPWREAAVKRGFRSSISLPLKYGDELYGALNVYAREPHAFDEKEVELLLHLAHNISYAISKLRTDAKREELDRLYRALVESTGTAIMVLDRDTKIQYANNHAERLIGFESGRWTGTALSRFLEFHERRKFEDILTQMAERDTDETKIFKLNLLREDGDVRECLATLTSINDRHLYVLSLVDVTEFKRVRKQIDDNIEKFAALVDGIRNPVTVIHGLTEIYVNDEELRNKIFNELDRIIDLVTRLEEGWIYSEKVRKFLRNSEELREQ